MEKHLVLVGAGHAHLTTLAHIIRFVEKRYRVTVIGPSDYHYYSGMGPGMLAGTYSAEQIRFATRRLVEKQGGVFVLDRVVRVDPKQKVLQLQSGPSIAYDVVSFNTGSYVPQDIVTDHGQDVFPVKPIENLIAARKRILQLASRKQLTIGIVGGGPSAVEIAGNVWRLTRQGGLDQPAISVFADHQLLPRLSPAVRLRVLRSLRQRGIAVIEESPVARVQSGAIRLVSGRTVSSDLIFVALGIRPSPIFRDSGLTTGPDGGLLVNAFLQSIDHPEIFGGGDCIRFQETALDKVGVYAVRQNPILYHNLMASLQGGPLKTFDPGGAYLLIFNMGDQTGILFKQRLVFSGRLAFVIKDAIDRRFMRKFQAYEQSA
jgi:NADH dehydrogenase FAD-containing subunit